MADRVGVHEAVIGVGLEVEPHRPSDERRVPVASRSSTRKSRCICIGTELLGHVGGRKSSTCWKAINAFGPVTAAQPDVPVAMPSVIVA